MTTEGKPRPEAKHARGIWLIIALFLVLSNIYGLITPIFEASDELYHYPYVHHLVTERRFPVQDPDNIQLWKQEGGQPPLYYLVVAAITFWIDTGDFAERLVHNPHAQIGLPNAPDNKNMVIHTSAEGFPFSGTALSVHLIRFLSTLMGAVTVFLTYRIAREILPGSKVLPLAAAAVTAYNPMFLFISASVNNDNLAALLCTLALWQMVRLVRSGATLRRVAALALVTGLAALTKMSALGLMGVVALVLTWDAWRRRSLRTWLLHGFLSAGLVAVIAGWWYLRNWMLYDDPLGFSVWLAISGARRIPPGIGGLLSEFEGFRISYWGLFGGVNVLMHPLLYRFYDLLTLLAVAGLVLGGGRWIARQTRKKRWRSILRGDAPRPIQMVVLGSWVLILLAALIRWTRLTRASQGRLIFPGIAAVSFCLALGWARLVPQRWRPVALGATGTTMLILAATAPWAFIAPAYYIPPPTVDALPDSLQPLHITYDDQIELVGYRLPEREVLPGQSLAVELGWRTLGSMDKDYSVFVHLYGRDDEFLGQADTYPGGGLLPTSQWSPGDQLLDTVHVSVTPDAQAPAVGRIVVGLYYFPDMTMLLARDPSGAALPPDPTIGRFKIAALEPPAYDIPRPAAYQLGHKLALVGYDLSAAPGEVTLYWQATEPVAVDYTVFVHLRDASGEQVAQADSQPQAGEYPTSFWGVDEQVVDRHVIPVEIVDRLPPGEYTFSVGLYDLDTGTRLPVSQGGVLQGDHIVLGPVTVP
ncbi:MAG: glycosyltransferase family 39 protein [Anaerolineae bacterium]|jgi:4-amino-4-deoxy-L-arabinose transferase-like glycosyltransferase